MTSGRPDIRAAIHRRGSSLPTRTLVSATAAAAAAARAEVDELSERYITDLLGRVLADGSSPEAE